MIRIADQTDLVESFRALDRDVVVTPPDLHFPLAVKDYLTWTEPSGHRIYLLCEDARAGKALGLVFERTRGAGDTPAAMCQWCHSVRRGSAIGLLSATVDRQRRVGIHLCADLSCKDNARGAPGINDFHEGLTSAERVHRIVDRMLDFAKRNLF